MTSVQRYDFAEIKATRTDEGFLHDSPVVGRVGIQEYRQADGSIRRELRLPEDVFHVDALASMRGKPISADHPKSGRVTAKDSHRVTIGTMLSEGRQDGDWVRTDIVVHNPDAMGDRRQLSLGYKADMDETPGEHPLYGKYDAIQRNIRVNHLSVVRFARAGSIAKLNLDSLDQDNDFSTQQEQHTMTVKVKLDSGIEYEAPPEVAAELNKLRADAKDATEKLKAIPAIEAQRDTLQAKVDGFADELEKAKAQGKADAEAKVKLDSVAAALKVDTKDKTPRQIKEAVIKAVTPKMNLDGKDDAYVEVAFDMAVEMKGDAAMAKQRQDAGQGGADKPVLTSEQKRIEAEARIVSGAKRENK